MSLALCVAPDYDTWWVVIVIMSKHRDQICWDRKEVVGTVIFFLFFFDQVSKQTVARKILTMKNRHLIIKPGKE